MYKRLNVYPVYVCVCVHYFVWDISDSRHVFKIAIDAYIQGFDGSLVYAPRNVQCMRRFIDVFGCDGVRARPKECL